jgi:hypothetical protein
MSRTERIRRPGIAGLDRNQPPPRNLFFEQNRLGRAAGAVITGSMAAGSGVNRWMRPLEGGEGRTWIFSACHFAALNYEPSLFLWLRRRRASGRLRAVAAHIEFAVQNRTDTACLIAASWKKAVNPFVTPGVSMPHWKYLGSKSFDLYLATSAFQIDQVMN